MIKKESEKKAKREKKGKRNREKDKRREKDEEAKGLRWKRSGDKKARRSQIPTIQGLEEGVLDGDHFSTKSATRPTKKPQLSGKKRR